MSSPVIRTLSEQSARSPKGTVRRSPTATAFALAGVGGNNAHGAGFLAAAQELYRQRHQAAAAAGSNDSSMTDGEGDHRQGRPPILPELEFISCTSGMIAPVVTYLAGKDVRKETERSIAALDQTNWLPRSALFEPWRAVGVMLLTGVPHVFGPWIEAFSAHAIRRVVEFFDRTSTSYGVIPTTFNEFADLWLPARAFVPKRSPNFFTEAAEVLNSANHQVGVAFNSFDPHTGMEHLYVNVEGLKLIQKRYDESAEYGRSHGRTVYQRITPQAIRNALWLFYYGFPTGPLGPNQHVDGAYARSIILNELVGAQRIYAVKPINDRWLGPLPQNLFEVADMQLEFWMEASYREQYRLITTINDLHKAGRLSPKAASGDGNGQVVAEEDPRVSRVRGKDYEQVELIPVEIGMQRGLFTYFIEDRNVFRDAYNQSLRLLLQQDEEDALRARGRPAPAPLDRMATSHSGGTGETQ